MGKAEDMNVWTFATFCFFTWSILLLAKYCFDASNDQSESMIDTFKAIDVVGVIAYGIGVMSLIFVVSAERPGLKTAVVMEGLSATFGKGTKADDATKDVLLASAAANRNHPPTKDSGPVSYFVSVLVSNRRTLTLAHKFAALTWFLIDVSNAYHNPGMHLTFVNFGAFLLFMLATLVDLVIDGAYERLTFLQNLILTIGALLLLIAEGLVWGSTGVTTGSIDTSGSAASWMCHNCNATNMSMSSVTRTSVVSSVTPNCTTPLYTTAADVMGDSTDAIRGLHIAGAIMLMLGYLISFPQIARMIPWLKNGLPCFEKHKDDLHF